MIDMNAIITISLKPHLSDFLRHEFQKSTKGDIILNQRHDIGKLIVSLLCVGEFPVKEPEVDNPCTIILPVIQDIDLSSRFIHITKWGQVKIQNYIEAEFNQRSRYFFECGYRANRPQKQIIEAFLAGYNIKHYALSFDAVKKNDYRKRKKLNQTIFKEIQSVEL